MPTQQEILNAILAALKTAGEGGAAKMPYEGAIISISAALVAGFHLAEVVIANQDPAVRQKQTEIMLALLEGPAAALKAWNELIGLSAAKAATSPQ